MQVHQKELKNEMGLIGYSSIYVKIIYMSFPKLN